MKIELQLDIQKLDEQYRLVIESIKKDVAQNGGVKKYADAHGMTYETLRRIVVGKGQPSVAILKSLIV